MMYDEAIYELYSNAVTVSVDRENQIYEAFDDGGNAITIDLDALETKASELYVVAKLERLRAERNRLLAETDYWTLSDTPAATDAQLAYRIALRNIPLTYTSLDDVVWPNKP
jgi:hypothetical protein